MGLIEDQELERRVVEEVYVLAAGEQQLEHLGVGEQDARLAAGFTHDFAAGALLRWAQDGRLSCFAELS